MYNYLSIQKGQTVLEQKEILSKLKELKPTYEKEGLILVGLFGSYAKETQNSLNLLKLIVQSENDIENNKIISQESMFENLEKKLFG